MIERHLDASAAPPQLNTLMTRLSEPSGTPLHRFSPPKDGARSSAVLIAFADGEHGLDVLITERSTTLRKHNGQVAFPGGASDPGDTGPLSTALREANEEVGLDPAVVAPLAILPTVYIPVTRYAVTPVLGWIDTAYEFYVREPREVARVSRLALRELVDPANRFVVTSPSGFRGSAFDVEGYFIWGVTAGLLSGVLEMGGFATPWDESIERELPERFLR